MFGRHSLVWLTERGWDRLHCDRTVATTAAIAQWRRSGWPLVARRADVETRTDHVCVGLALPPDPVTGQKIRIPIQVPILEIKTVTPPLRLSDVIHRAPAGWREALAALVAETGDGDSAFNVFGSLSWQTITGLDYLTSRSDIDLLFYPDSQAALQRALGLLERYAMLLPLDGEIVFPDGLAVSWKEWSRAINGISRERVMVKGDHTVSLMYANDLLALLDFTTIGIHTCVN